MNNHAIMSQLSGAWFMAEDRVRALFARAQSAPAPRADYSSDSSAGECNYSVVNRVAKIEIVGVLTKYPDEYDDWFGFCPTVPIMGMLQKALDDFGVDSIIFVIDSPGGMVSGTNELAEAIASADKLKPCYAVVSDQAASGGYYLASQCRTISCNAMGEVGCIGVYTVLADYSKAYDAFGLKLTVVSSGGVKGLGADGVVSQELVDDQKRGVMAMYEKFVADVATGRGISIEDATKLGDGRCWLAKEALELGLIDSVEAVASAIMAATQETSRMNAEAFKSYAAANPDSAEVKEVKVGAYAEGVRVGTADASRASIDRLKTVRAACGTNDTLACDLFIANKDADDAKLTIEAVAKAKAEAKAESDAHAATLAAKDAEIERLKALNGTQSSISTAPKTEGGDGTPESTAKAEWASNKDACQDKFVNEKVYVNVRLRELAETK